MGSEYAYEPARQPKSSSGGFDHNRRVTNVFILISLVVIAEPIALLVVGKSSGRYVMHPVALLAFASVGFGWLITALSTAFFDFHDAEVVRPKGETGQSVASY